MVPVKAPVIRVIFKTIGYATEAIGGTANIPASIIFSQFRSHSAP